MVGMLEVNPELVEIDGKKKVKITVRKEGEVLDADLVNPLNATAGPAATGRLPAG